MATVEKSQLDEFGRYTNTDSNTTEATVEDEPALKSMPKEWLKTNTLTSLSVVVMEFLLMALSVVVAEKTPYLSWVAKSLAVIYIGNRMFVVGEELLHEASHFKLFTNRKLNVYFGDYVLGIPFLNEFHSYHLEHWKHHKNILSADDALAFDYKNWGLMDKEKNFFYIFWVQPLIGFIQWDFICRVASQLRHNHMYFTKVTVYYGLLSAVSFYFGVFDKFLLYWVFPLIWVHPVFLFWSEVEDHYGSTTGSRTNLSWNPFMYPYNSGYHYAHHVYPYVPWTHLPKVHFEYCAGKSDEVSGFFDAYSQMANPKQKKQ